MLLARWTQDALDAQLRPKFYEECPPELLGKWNAKEEYQSFTNGSILYMRALKTSDDAARFSKIAGLTLAVIGVDQPEEVPEDVYAALKARLSQPGYPQQMLLTPNPPNVLHWLCDEFPEDNHIDGHRYILTSVYDNRHIVGDNYIAELERDYPPGHVLRRRFIEGRRGLSLVGQPVYGKVFSRSLHVQEIDHIPDVPLVESWDFGQKHPAVSWHQFTPWGHWNILAEYMGQRMFIDEVVQAVAARRAELFPNLTDLRVCCDPAGADKQGHGIRQTAVDVLNQHLRMLYGANVGARFAVGSNRPERREFAIQQISGFLSRLIQGRPALAVHPRCEMLIDGFEAGYVYDERAYSASAFPNIRRPKKDGTYDHLQNTTEYAYLNYGGSPLQSADERTIQDRVRRAQMDPDEFTWGSPRRRMTSRAGY
ncbi:MAG: hypothetical protein NUW01_06645 [Gemmatimonadaceae bacterium]|nr:hypothetical protein [Gemmatimonadaceae bacterium]